MRRLEKTKSELDFEKHEKDCTFAPKINKKVVGSVRAEIYAKDIDKTIVRMVQGRKEREARNRMLARDVNSQHTQKPAKKAKSSSNNSQTFVEQPQENPFKDSGAKALPESFQYRQQPPAAGSRPNNAE